MEAAVKFIAVLLFLTFLASAIYSWICYERYRDLWPEQSARGILISFRASLRLVHDPLDPNVSEECRASFRQLGRSLALVALVYLVGFFFFVVIWLCGLKPS
jgi:hypothetical protein